MHKYIVVDVCMLVNHLSMDGIYSSETVNAADGCHYQYSQRQTGLAPLTMFISMACTLATSSVCFILGEREKKNCVASGAMPQPVVHKSTEQC